MLRGSVGLPTYVVVAHVFLPVLCSLAVVHFHVLISLLVLPQGVFRKLQHSLEVFIGDLSTIMVGVITLRLVAGRHGCEEMSNWWVETNSCYEETNDYWVKMVGWNVCFRVVLSWIGNCGVVALAFQVIGIVGVCLVISCCVVLCAFSR